LTVAHRFEALLQRLDQPTVVVTASAGGERAGCIAGFHTQCGIDPPRYAVWISRRHSTYRVAMAATHLGVHFLESSESDFVSLFGTSRPAVDKFGGLDLTEGAGGVPLLVRSTTRLVLELTPPIDDGSEHVAFTGTVVDAQVTPTFQPLRRSAAIAIRRADGG
jgi:flavin reductase (DIM6/NTAB) family NADH-FMN oxidoreductase RutF